MNTSEFTGTRMLRIIFCSLIIGLTAGGLAAQAPTQGDLVVTTDPPGALVTLKGEATVSGVAPAHFRHLLIGEYRLIVKLDGHEKYSSLINLDPSQQTEIDVRLARKTRVKSAARSMFIPGWGQRYAGQGTKGYAFTMLAAGAAAAFLIADNDFDSKYDEFVDLRDRYDSLRVHGTVDELAALSPELNRTQDDAYDAENMRRITIGAAIGVWALNVIDALLFFPDNNASFRVKGLTVTPEADLKNMGVQLTWAF